MGVMKKIAIFAMLIVFLLFAALIHFVANPIGACFSYGRIQAYIAEHFCDYDLDVSYPRFDFKGNHFESIATLRNNEDISFRVVDWGDGKFWNYYDQVAVGFLTQILEPELGNNLVLIQAYNPRITEPGQPGFRTSFAGIRLNIDAESKSPYDLANIMMDIISLIETNGHKFESYEFHFYGDVVQRMSIRSLCPQEVHIDELVLILTSIHDNFISTGRYRAISHTMGSQTRAWE
jgi:hypothetical protein